MTNRFFLLFASLLVLVVAGCTDSATDAGGTGSSVTIDGDTYSNQAVNLPSASALSTTITLAGTYNGQSATVSITTGDRMTGSFNWVSSNNATGMNAYVLLTIEGKLYGSVNGTVTITEWSNSSGGKVRGSFSGKMKQGAGAGEVDVTGSFNATIQ